MAMSMRREFPRSSYSLPVTDVENVIFLNTDVTSSYLMLASKDLKQE